jgi:ubiquinone/menaquinone biosynthesis C-methylase UbiE
MEHPEIYAREYYERLCDLEERHWWHLGMREVAAALLRSRPGNQPYERVLDVGCGTGGGLRWAEERLGARLTIGMDIAREALVLCRARSGQWLAQASALQLPWRSESFDLLLCQDVLQHLPTDGADVHALTEMARVLRPGGLLLMRTNSRLGMWQADTARDADFQRYTLPEVTSRVSAAGFIVQRATYANALPALYASLKRWGELRFQRHHPHQRRLYEGLRIRDTASQRAWLHRLLLWIMKAEARYLSAPNRCLAFGHSIFCLGVKPLDVTVAQFVEAAADICQDVQRRSTYGRG